MNPPQETARKPSPSQAQDLEHELEKKLDSLASQREENRGQDIAKATQLPFSDLKAVPVDPEALVIIDEERARRARIAVISRTGQELALVVIDPRLSPTAEIIESLTKKGFTLKIIVTTSEALERVLKRYQETKRAEQFETGAVTIREHEMEKLQQEIKTIEDLREKVVGISVTELLEILLAGAIRVGASDIHLEPEQDNVRIRYRLDGLLSDITTLTSENYRKALSRVKVLSGLKLNVHDTPQDGRFTIRQEAIVIEVRVSTLPSEYGETLVMRLLDPRTIKTRLEDFGMRPDILTLLTEQLKKPTGAIFTTGPTGSGKTTTLYAFVQHLNSSDTKIITIEDPIEYHLDGVSQTQVEPERGYTFANGLRAIVRQDPDIILVGEIRDAETADIALHAALTGHQVFSTLHTNDAAGTIARLIDLGIQPQIIAPAINVAMAQRLVRRLCTDCRIKDSATPEQYAKLKKSLSSLAVRFALPAFTENLSLYYPGSCAKCNNTGYRGRIGVYEVFTITRAMEKLILGSPAISEVHDLAVQEGMVTLLQDGYLKILEGITSFEEVERILGT